MSQDKIYKMITERIISQLEAGTVPWKKTWAAQGLPKNIVTKKPYRGINFLVLAGMGEYFLTFNQAKKLGGSIKKGAKGLPVVFWKFVDVEDALTGEIKSVPFLRYYTVFSASDAEGIDIPQGDNTTQTNCFEAIEEAEKIVSGMPNAPETIHGGDRAAYSITFDRIRLPERGYFDTPADYYATRFHEMVHSTGAAHRLNRDELADYCGFGTYQYSKEELTAEMGAAFLCAMCGISSETIENSASYIDSWLNKLRKDVKLVIQAAGKAQKAADYILNIKPQAEETESA